MNLFSRESTEHAGLGTAEVLLFFCMVLPVAVLGGTLLQEWSVKKGTLFTEWGLILLPVLLYLKIRGKNIRRTLQISMPPRRHVLASFILAISAIPLIAELSFIQDTIIPMPVELTDTMKAIFTIKEGESVVFMFFVFAITPAICEEGLFRGFLLGGLRNGLGKTGAILLTGFLFGLFHLNIYRLLPTAIIGFILAYLVISGSSLITAVIYHAVNNAIALSIINSSHLQKYPWLLEENHIPIPVLVFSIMTFIYGISLLRRSVPRNDGNNGQWRST